MSRESEDQILQRADFFISYTRVDEKTAEWIAWCLEDSGYRVIIDKWDFRPGHNFALMMHRAATIARHTIAVLSNAYMEALFTQSEWTASFIQDPTGLSRKLIPVRIEECRPNGLLRGIIYIDLVEYLRKDDRDGAKEALLAGIRGGRAKPENEPPFPAYRE